MTLAKIFNEAGATLGRIIQQAEEVFLDVPRTHYTEEYKNNIKKVDFLILMTEKLIIDAQTFLDPSSESSERRMPTEEFGISLQNPLTGTKEYSPVLYKDMHRSGKYQRKLGFLLNNYQTKALDTYVMKLKKLIEVDFKNLKDEEVSLENTRLDHDYIKNRVENAFTTAGREALERELEKIKPIFEKHYSRTMENFRNVDNYFTLHRQFLKEFIDIQRNYYRECDRNLTSLVKKLHGDTYRITYELGVDQYPEGFISSSDVDEMINRGKMLAIEKLNQSIQKQNNEDENVSPQIKIEAEIENAESDDDNCIVGYKLTTERSALEPIYDQEEIVLNGHMNGYGYDHDVLDSSGTNGIQIFHPIRVVVENENRNADEALNMSLGLEDDNEQYKICAKPFQEPVGGFIEEKLETPDLSYSIKIEEIGINEFSCQDDIIVSNTFQRESCGIAMDNIIETDAQQSSLDVNPELGTSDTITCIGEISIGQPDLNLFGTDNTNINLEVDNNTYATVDLTISPGEILTVKPISLDNELETGAISSECNVNLNLEPINENENDIGDLTITGEIDIEAPTFSLNSEITVESPKIPPTKPRDIDHIFGTEFEAEEDLAEEFLEDTAEDPETYVSFEANVSLGCTIETKEDQIEQLKVEIIDANAAIETEADSKIELELPDASVGVNLGLNVEGDINIEGGLGLGATMEEPETKDHGSFEDLNATVQLKTEDSDKKDIFSARGGLKSSFGFSGGVRTKSRSPVLQSGEKEE